MVKEVCVCVCIHLSCIVNRGALRTSIQQVNDCYNWVWGGEGSCNGSHRRKEGHSPQLRTQAGRPRPMGCIKYGKQRSVWMVGLGRVRLRPALQNFPLDHSDVSLYWLQNKKWRLRMLGRQSGNASEYSLSDVMEEKSDTNGKSSRWIVTPPRSARTFQW